jgi:DNA-binding NtrC family response regulator
MTKKSTKILILENEVFFRDRLQGLCSEMGRTFVADDMESALELLTQHSFQLLLLDWHLVQLDFSDFWSIIDNLQPDAFRIALFRSPLLQDVIAAMKSGMNDVFWAYQDTAVLKSKLKDSLSREKPSTVTHSYISQLADFLTDRAVSKKTSLSEARKEFSKIFLSQILSQQKIRRFQLADLMSVTSRTLRRHLSK